MDAYYQTTLCILFRYCSSSLLYIYDNEPLEAKETMEKHHQTIINLPRELFVRVERFASETGTTMSNVVIEALDTFLLNNSRNPENKK